MKKTLTVNLNGIVFHIDDDAYQILSTYLTEVAAHLGDGDDTSEIISDVEARMAEVFGEQLATQRKEVVTVDMVQQIVERLGKPSDYAEAEGEDQVNAPKKKGRKVRKFYRDPDNAVLGGVVAGFSAYIGWEPIVLRVLLAVFAFFMWGSLFLVYLLVWLLAPAARTQAQRLEMRGEDVTVDNIKREFSAAGESAGADYVQSNKREIVERLRSVFFWVVRTCFTLVAIFFGFVGFVIVAALVVSLFALIFGTGAILSLFPELPFSGLFLGIVPWQVVAMLIALIVFVGTPLVMILAWAVKYVRSKRGTTAKFNVTSMVVWFLSLLLLVSLFFGNMAVIGRNIRENGLGEFNVKIHRNGHIYRNPSAQIKWNGGDSEFVAGERVDGYHSVELTGCFDVECVQGESDHIVFKGSEQDVKAVKYEVRDSVLYVFAPDSEFSDEVHLQLTMPELHSVVVTGACELESEGVFVQESMKLDLSGGSSVDMDVILSDELRVELSGAGKLELEGSAPVFVLDASGPSKVEADDLQVMNAQIEVSGESKVDLWVSELLEVQASGESLISYKGSPSVNEKEMSGMSILRRK